MNDIRFYKSTGPHKLSKIFPKEKFSNDIDIIDIKTLKKATSKDLTFLDSNKYLPEAENTKAKFCLTNARLAKKLPSNVKPILVKNVLLELAKIVNMFYPNSEIDDIDQSLTRPSKSKYKNVYFSENTLIGLDVKIGQDTKIGSNSIIEHHVHIGKNCIIGHDVHIKNSIIGDNVIVQSGTKIGIKGFGFIPSKENNLKFPHIGKVIISSNCELGANCTIDRGSVDDTEIGFNTYLDNQVHVAHNVKIGNNCMIAGQVGFAGSCVIGNNVSIGGQAGISGHLKVGNNVKIGGGSGVVKDIADNQVVMGYPAISFKDFIKRWKYEK